MDIKYKTLIGGLTMDEKTNLEIETQNAVELLDNLFAGGLVVTAIGLIILTAIYL